MCFTTDVYKMYIIKVHAVSNMADGGKKKQNMFWKVAIIEEKGSKSCSFFLYKFVLLTLRRNWKCCQAKTQTVSHALFHNQNDFSSDLHGSGCVRFVLFHRHHLRYAPPHIYLEFIYHHKQDTSAHEWVQVTNVTQRTQRSEPSCPDIRESYSILFDMNR